jgi:hypothetical protein
MGGTGLEPVTANQCQRATASRGETHVVALAGGHLPAKSVPLSGDIPEHLPSPVSLGLEQLGA